jgi:hypothetical protein
MTALTLADVKRPRSWIYWYRLDTIICLAAIAISMALNAFTVQWLVPDGPAKALGIAASVALDAWKARAPVRVSNLYQGGMWVGATSCGLSWLIAFAISFAMAASFSVVTRDDAATQRSDAAESREGLRAEVKRQAA